jgi:hypothetical protein
MKNLIIMMTLIHKIPPTSLYRGRNYPSLAKRGEGRFSGVRVNLNDAKNIIQKSPSPFPLPVGERGRGEGLKITAGDVPQARGKAICTA